MDFCRQLRLLEGRFTADVNATIAAAGNADSTPAARVFKSKIDALTLAYEPLAQKIIDAAKSDSSSITFASQALKDANRAEKHAIELYSWAREFIPQDADTQADMDKTAKLKLIPYLVAMVYAVRVQLDVQYVDDHKSTRAERQGYLGRSRNIAEQLLAILAMAMRTLLQDSSLLEVALDYHIALTTCVESIKALRKCVQMMLAPSSVRESTELWDDELSEIR